MTDTINVAINTPDVWVPTVTGPTTGTANITTGGQHCIQTGAPSVDLIGHRFTGDPVYFSLADGETLYVKSGRTASLTNVIITED